MTQIALNDRLASASKKFTKACEQIKLLKQQLAVYIAMFSDFSDICENSSNSNNDHDQSPTLQTPKIDYNVNLSREMVRQKIESLQNFKNVFFTYAHQKADEITKIQCELYGEDAVRNAYDSPVDTVEQSTQVDANATESNETSENSEAPGEEEVDNNEWDPSTSYWSTTYDQENAELTNRPSQLQLIEYDFLTA